MLFELRRRETRLVDVDRNNHLNVLEKDPTDIEVRETEFARKGSFARRKFTKGEFIEPPWCYKRDVKLWQYLRIWHWKTRPYCDWSQQLSWSLWYKKYKELSASNFLNLSFRLNCRSGPILNLIWDDVPTIKQTGALETDQHKTGSFYDVTLKIEDQHVWLKRMRRQFIKAFQMSPTLVFPTSNITVDHSMSRTIRTVLGNLFHVLKDVDKISTQQLSGKCGTLIFTEIRTLWHMFAAHLEQTGHTELTALKNYVVSGDKIQTLQIYLDQLSTLDKQGTSVLQTPFDWKTPKHAQTPSHGKTPSGDKTYWKEKTPLQSETPSKEKTPLRNKPKVNCTPGSTSDRSTSDSTPAPP